MLGYLLSLIHSNRDSTSHRDGSLLVIHRQGHRSRATTIYPPSHYALHGLCTGQVPASTAKQTRRDILKFSHLVVVLSRPTDQSRHIYEHDTQVGSVGRKFTERESRTPGHPRFRGDIQTRVDISARDYPCQLAALQAERTEYLKPGKYL